MSILVIALVGVLVLVGAALGVVSALVLDHRRAESAADLAALAAARTQADGGDGCAAAAAVATANGATMLSCAPAGGDVTVLVSVTGPRWLGQHHDLQARARAGPAQA